MAHKALRHRAALLCLVACLSAAACSDDDFRPDNNSGDTSTDSTPVFDNDPRTTDTGG